MTRVPSAKPANTGERKGDFAEAMKIGSDLISRADGEYPADCHFGGELSAFYARMN